MTPRTPQIIFRGSPFTRFFQCPARQQGPWAVFVGMGGSIALPLVVPSPWSFGSPQSMPWWPSYGQMKPCWQTWHCGHLTLGTQGTQGTEGTCTQAPPSPTRVWGHVPWVPQDGCVFLQNTNGKSADQRIGWVTSKKWDQGWDNEILRKIFQFTPVCEVWSILVERSCTKVAY